MKIFIRADADPAMGTGHIMRCLALALELKSAGAQVSFICAQIPQAHARLLGDNGFIVEKIDVTGQWRPENDAELTGEIIEQSGVAIGTDWVIADRPGLDAQWDKAIRSHARLLVIDDLALVRRDCDILLNQNYLPGVKDQYAAIMGAPPCRLLTGPRYALLLRQFATASNARARDGNVKKVLVSFGGGNQAPATLKTVRALAGLCSPELVVDVAVGVGDRKLARLADELPNVTLHINTDDMASLMVNADIAIGAFGVSTWERLCVGVPSIVNTVADIQERPAQALADDGYVVYLGCDGEVSPESIAKAVNRLSDDPALVKFLSRRGMELVDGFGAKRTAQTVIPDYP